jgi:hypothetical protein
MNIQRVGVAVLLALVATACTNAVDPLSPSRRRFTVPATSVPDNPPVAPELLEVARVYDPVPPTYQGQPSGVGTRYVLFNDGTFELQMFAQGDLHGTYQEQDGMVALNFGDWLSGRGFATAVIDDELLEVRYNDFMIDIDFASSTYKRITAPSTESFRTSR